MQEQGNSTQAVFEAKTAPTWFRDHFALGQLPWFEVRDGRLVLADRSVGPIADVHTHLALAFGRRMQVDLHKAHPRTHHYLPMEGPLDLDVYINKNFTPEGLRRMKFDLSFASLGPGGMRATHTAPNLAAEMNDLGIAKCVLLPIDFPAFSWNAEAYLEVVKVRRELLSLGSVHPMASRVAEKLEAQKAAGALGVKVHPAVQLIPPDHPKCMALYEICGELGLPILWHCGPVDIEPRLGRYFSQLKHYWRAVAEHPRTTFILGHSGALQFERGLELAQRYPNVWLETSSQSLTNVRRILREGPTDRVMHGSDWPFYHQAPSIAKLLLASEGQPELRRRVLWENAARLFGFSA